MITKIKKTVAVIVAHPDDEILWVGGTILSHPEYVWYIVSLCRGNDNDRAPKFFKALKMIKANGIMGDLDDEPEQKPMDATEVENAILDLLPVKHFDLIISHSPNGEYTRHIRHEEIGKAVINLWQKNQIATNEYWSFAYDDGHKKYLPRPDEKATIRNTLTKQIWGKKYKIMTEIYGFETNSWEAQTTPQIETFWKFEKPEDARKWYGWM